MGAGREVGSSIGSWLAGGRPGGFGAATHELLTICSGSKVSLVRASGVGGLPLRVPPSNRDFCLYFQWWALGYRKSDYFQMYSRKLAVPELIVCFVSAGSGRPWLLGLDSNSEGF